MKSYSNKVKDMYLYLSQNNNFSDIFIAFFVLLYSTFIITYHFIF